MRRRDYKVPFRSEQSIADSAASLRWRAGVRTISQGSIVKILEIA